ncbi:MAG: hypothetical protein Kow0040_07740 [Thermogutta sp.]
MRLRQRGTRLIPRVMAPLAWTASLFGIAAAWPWSVSAPPEPPHPAVARIIALDLKGASLGTGTLVAVSDAHGLVVTNWHVVRDARGGSILVLFPDGFASPATVLKTDRDWDLAALAIWRPRATPVAIAREAPRPGEWLAIAGYGQGAYRTVKGICTQYLSPTLNLPKELVELRASARQGDSGGPIFNSRGELAGVLFGSGGSETMGAYCGRVREFLAPLKETFYQLPIPQGVSPQLLAAGPPTLNPGETSALTTAAPNSPIGGTPPLENISVNSGRAKGAATSPVSESIPLTAVAASTLPGGTTGSSYGTYGSYGIAGQSAANGATSSTYAGTLGASGSNGAGAWGNNPAKTGSGSTSAATSLAQSSAGKGDIQWRPGSAGGYSGTNANANGNTNGNGIAGYGYGTSTASTIPGTKTYQANEGLAGNSSGPTSYTPSQSSGSSYSYLDGTDYRGKTAYGDSSRGNDRSTGNLASSGGASYGSGNVSGSFSSGDTQRDSSSSGYGYQSYAPGGAPGSSQYGRSSSEGDIAHSGSQADIYRPTNESREPPYSRGYQDQRDSADLRSGGGLASGSTNGSNSDSGRYSTPYGSSSYADSGGRYAERSSTAESRAGGKPYTSDLADRTWDYDRESSSESQRNPSSSGITASIGGSGSRSGSTERTSESFSTRIPDSGSRGTSDARPIPSEDTSRYSGGSSVTPNSRSGYDSSDYRDSKYGYGGDAEDYDDGTEYDYGNASGYASQTARSASDGSSNSQGPQSSQERHGMRGYGYDDTRDKSSGTAYTSGGRSDESSSYGYSNERSSYTGRAESERTSTDYGGMKNGDGARAYGYGTTGESYEGREGERTKPAYGTPSSAYDLDSGATRERDKRGDRNSTTSSAASRDSNSGYASPRPSTDDYSSSTSGGKVSSGATSSARYGGQDDRSDYTGYTSRHENASVTSGSRTAAIPTTVTSESDTPSQASHPSGAATGNSSSDTNPTASSSPPGDSSGIGIETLLGLVGLLILFVQSMRWLSGFYDRAYRRRRSWRTGRRRPYYERDVRPVYRSYW